MPVRPPSRCSEPGCRELTTEGRCDDHKRKPWAGRDDKAARYDGVSSGEWRSLRARVSRRDNGCCYMCGLSPDEDPEAPAAMVLDHKVPVAEGGAARDLDNLGLLCPPCDQVKSTAETERGRQRHLARRRGITPP